ncbi:MAG TPA: S1/P1 nuclease [Sphingobacteriaceae bacterium]
MKLNFKKLAVLALALYLPLQSMAWGQLGHRIVGQIADCHIRNKTRKEIRKILGNESIAMASNWADFIKSDPAYKYLDSWHYVNLPKGLDADGFQLFLKQDTAANAYNRIQFLTSELKNKQLPHDKKVMYLKLLIHFVGDIHQPMHTGRREDLGGNAIKVQWFGQSSNLHRVWDSDLIGSENLSFTEYARAINFATKAQLFTLQRQPLDHWVYDSYKIAENLYTVTKPESRLSYRYIYDHIATANQQLLRGGIHLAGLLDEIFS